MKTLINKEKNCISMRWIGYLLVIIALSATVIAPPVYYGDPINNEDNPQRDPRIQGWYAIADWELEVCQKWGGTAEAQQVIGTTISQEQFVSQLTLTLQAQKTVYPDNTTLYEVAYYIQPLAETVDFAVRLKYASNKTMRNIQSKTTLEPPNSASDYKTFISSDNFDIAQIRLKTNTTDNILTVPIVDAANGYFQYPAAQTQNDVPGSTGTQGSNSDWGDW